MISAGNQKVLFDAFYTNSYGQYALIPAETQQQLLDGEPPWDNISALLISHVHGDHFSPAPTLTYLQANPDVQVYASTQVTEQLTGSIAAERLHGIALEAGDTPVKLKLNDLVIEAVRIPHAGGSRTADIANLAFRVNFADDFTILHMGDADPDSKHFSPYKSYWDSRSLETAFPPYWFLNNDNGKAILADHLRAQQVIGIHVPIAAAEDPHAWKIRYQGDLFTTPGEIRAVGVSDCDSTR